MKFRLVFIGTAQKTSAMHNKGQYRLINCHRNFDYLNDGLKRVFLRQQNTISPKNQLANQCNFQAQCRYARKNDKKKKFKTIFEKPNIGYIKLFNQSIDYSLKWDDNVFQMSNRKPHTVPLHKIATF